MYQPPPHLYKYIYIYKEKSDSMFPQIRIKHLLIHFLILFIFRYLLFI